MSMSRLPPTAKVKEFCRCDLGLQLVDLKLIKRETTVCVSDPARALSTEA